MKSIVIRDANGALINIGPWDECRQPQDKGPDIIVNPFPAGAVISEEEIVIGLDGGRYIAGDPRAET